MRRFSSTFAALLLAASAALASPAFGQEDGVTLDPSDPAAKEYALPVEQARREASGTGDSPVAQGSRTAETFGVGVTPDAEKKKQDAGKSAKDETPATTPAASGSDGGDGSSAPATETQTASADMGSTAALVGGGLATLLVAGLGGFALRALRGPTDG